MVPRTLPIGSPSSYFHTSQVLTLASFLLLNPKIRHSLAINLKSIVVYHLSIQEGGSFVQHIKWTEKGSEIKGGLSRSAQPTVNILIRN